MKIRSFLPLLLPLFLSACGLSPQQKADYAQVEESGVSPAVYDSSAIILRYLRDHGTVYYISSSDVTSLEKAGVDRSVIDYMLQTARGGYSGGGPYPYDGFYDPYWYGPPWYGPGFYGGFYGGHYQGHYHH